mgnify:CR=1 FL=1
MPFVFVAESVCGGAVVEVAVRRMPWSMSSQGGRCKEVAVEPRAQEGTELVMGLVVSK